MVHVFIQIFFMQRVMRMNFVRTTMLEQEQLQLMYVHAVCDMYSKSSAFMSALVIILRYGTQFLIVETFKIR